MQTPSTNVILDEDGFGVSSLSDNIIVNKDKPTMAKKPSNPLIDNVIQIAMRPPSPEPKDASLYEQSDGKCNIPYCPVHGIAAKLGSKIKRSRSRSINLDGESRGTRTREINIDGERQDNGDHKDFGRSASDGYLIMTHGPVCIKDSQKKLMRDLPRNSTDSMVQQSIEKKDIMNKELQRRSSAPPRVVSNQFDV